MQGNPSSYSAKCNGAMVPVVLDLGGDLMDADPREERMVHTRPRPVSAGLTQIDPPPVRVQAPVTPGGKSDHVVDAGRNPGGQLSDVMLRRPGRAGIGGERKPGLATKRHPQSPAGASTDQHPADGMIPIVDRERQPSEDEPGIAISAVDIAVPGQERGEGQVAPRHRSRCAPHAHPQQDPFAGRAGLSGQAGIRERKDHHPLCATKLDRLNHLGETELRPRRTPPQKQDQSQEQQGDEAAHGISGIRMDTRSLYPGLAEIHTLVCISA